VSPQQNTPQAAELLALCELFFRTASPAVQHELAEFLEALGAHPIAGPPAFLDQLQFVATRRPV
jgi:hypothetical protein